MVSRMDESLPYQGNIPNADEFSEIRSQWRVSMAGDELLRSKAIDLTISSSRYNFGYQWDWCGIPIIRHPDDIVLQQEIVWALKPTHIIETGVARGGSLALSASLMEMTGITGRVLGLDIQILPHARDALQGWISKGTVELFECDSTSNEAISCTKKFLGDVKTPVLMVLDSNHSHRHVLNELTSLTPLLPPGSIVMVADTIIEEMPETFYSDRPWARGNNPLTAVREFLDKRTDFEPELRWGRRSLMGECRDGIIIKLKNDLSQSKA
jgi:cephalosporin hydroxylase